MLGMFNPLLYRSRSLRRTLAWLYALVMVLLWQVSPALPT